MDKLMGLLKRDNDFERDALIGMGVLYRNGKQCSTR